MGDLAMTKRKRISAISAKMNYILTKILLLRFIRIRFFATSKNWKRFQSFKHALEI